MRSLVSFFIIISMSISIFAQKQTKQITLENIWISNTFYPEMMGDYQMYPNKDAYTIIQNNAIVLYDLKTDKIIKELLPNSVTNKAGIFIEDYSISPNANFILIFTNTKQIYRHSTESDVYLYNVKTKMLYRLPGKQNIRLAEISPDESHVAYVKENNLYIYNIANNTEKAITTDGKYNFIIYGTTDWVNEEEFSFTKAFQWSHDGKYIAYYRFDESEVKEFTLNFYNNDVYPEYFKYKYPKAGEDNALLDLFIYNIENDKNTKLNLGEERDIYIPRIKWLKNDNQLAVIRLNRLQNHLEILLYAPDNINGKKVYDEINKAYIDITDNWFMTSDGGWFYTSEKDGYNHIYYLNPTTKIDKQITSGTWDVKDIVGIDEKNTNIYYTSYEDGPINIMCYVVNYQTGNKKKIISDLGTHNPTFSSTFNYMIDAYSTINTPPEYNVYDVNKGKVVREIITNEKLKNNLSEYGFVPAEFFEFTTKDNITLNGWMIKPAIEPGKHYPVLMYVYGGPGVNTVKNSWGYSDFIWFQMLAQQGYIVVSVDNRGTGGRGEEFKKCTYLQLGKLESDDQIEANKYLRTLPFVDSTRIGSFGWSYGGFMTALAMTKGANYFKAGISVAPVTNWKFYDNIYTERFMRKPIENPDGYEKNSPIFYAKKLKGNFLLIHGDADDNVHVQNTMELVNALVKNNKQFDLFIYPNKNHGIYGGYTRYHLYKKMTDFLYDNL
ncbi:MAG: S9 family peptidase [Bacteroidales bacterium]|jgi:dipeptidyl-peptidase-4